jgi:uncharacterized protein
MVLTDSGYWLALANRKDRWHQRALSVSRKLNEDLVITWPVLTETCYLLLKRLGVTAQTRFLIQAEQVTTVFPLSFEDLERCRLLMVQYANLPMDLADASLVIAAEELGNGAILSTDQRDFQTYRWKNHHPFTNLLAP